MTRLVLASLLALGCACNSAPANTCATLVNSVAAAGMPPTSCDGICVNAQSIVGDAGSSAAFEVCTKDCTDGGTAICSAGATCVSGQPYTSHSYCLVTCGGDAGDAGTCPNGLVCIPDAGVCL